MLKILGIIILAIVAFVVLQLIFGWILGRITGRKEGKNIKAIFDEIEEKKKQGKN
jgi:uncharacterized OB-fold protein